MATKVQLTGGNFQDALGSPLAGGYLEMVLSQDAVTTDQKEVAAGYIVRIDLDDTGSVIASPAQSVWPNDQLLPSGTFYNVSGFSAQGALVWGPNAQQVVGASPFDVGTWVPGSVNITSGFNVLLQTNGVNNGSQRKLNLVAGSDITITDDGSGDVTIAATGGGTGFVELNPTTSQVVTQPSGTALAVTDTVGTTVFEVSEGAIELTTAGTATIGLQDAGVAGNTLASVGIDSTVIQLNCLDLCVSSVPMSVTTGATTLSPSSTTAPLILCGVHTPTGNISVTLPTYPADLVSSTGAVPIILFKRVDSTAFTLTINANSGKTIDGASSYSLNSQYSWVKLLYVDVVNLWTVVGHS